MTGQAKLSGVWQKERVGKDEESRNVMEDETRRVNQGANWCVALGPRTAKSAAARPNVGGVHRAGRWS